MDSIVQETQVPEQTQEPSDEPSKEKRKKKVAKQWWTREEKKTMVKGWLKYSRMIYVGDHQKGDTFRGLVYEYFKLKSLNTALH